ncbi:unnamed protein product [Clavelina lepadiformis]|uniref:Uncharacterized protein n=1 Tax=Clavelina lepadiformis TaxID=159417 RepID=A0ABP0EYV9_CLALP
MQQQNMAELEDLTSLQNECEFESLKSEVQDSERISAELRTSLETEKQRSQETLSALKQEQKRNLELTAMVELSCNEAEKLKRQIDTLRMSLRAVNKMLTITEDERKELEEQKMKEMRRKAQREELEKLVNPYYPNDNTASVITTCQTSTKKKIRCFRQHLPFIFAQTQQLTNTYLNVSRSMKR